MVRAYPGGSGCPGTTEGKSVMHNHLPAEGFREIRLVVPDARAQATRARIAAQVARLNPAAEQDALDWIETVGDFDADQDDDAAR